MKTLHEQPPYTWHKLADMPDRAGYSKTKSPGRTAFEACWFQRDGDIGPSVHTREGKGQPSYRISGAGRVAAYLAVECSL